MWFLFGFITLLLFCVLSAWMRIKARWSGDTEKIAGYTYLRQLVTHKGDAKSLRIGITAPDHLSFIFKRETRMDRVFKGIGLSSEHQVGHSRFDDMVYIVSDDAQLCRKLSSEKDIQARVLEIFNIGSSTCRTKLIRCHGGRLWIEYKASGDADELDTTSIEQAVVPLLHQLAEELSAIPRTAGRRWNDPFALKAIAILSVSTGLAINAAIQLARIYAVGEIPFTVDATALWKMATLIALLGLIGSFFAVTLLLGGSARAHLVLIEVLLVGGLGLAGSAFVELRDLNMEWDVGQEVRHEARLVEKEVRKGRRGSRSYYLVVQDWRDHNSRYEIKISRTGYDRAMRNDVLSVYQRPGYMEIPWVSKLRTSYGTVLE